MPPTIDPNDARIERDFKAPRPLTACRFDPAGRFLFAAAEDNTIYRFDLLTGRQAAFTTHMSWVRGLAFVTPAKPDPGGIPLAIPLAVRERHGCPDQVRA